MSNLDFMSKFKPETRCIKEFKYWIVCIRQKVSTLGDAVILLKRETPSVGGMLPEEASEFPEVVRWYEDLCTKKFGAVKFNYVIMMMKDFFVHYHAFPRYDKDIEMFNNIWIDKTFPGPIDFVDGTILEEDLLMEIKDYMKE